MEVVVAQVYNCFDNVSNHNISLCIQHYSKLVFLHPALHSMYLHLVDTIPSNHTG